MVGIKLYIHDTLLIGKDEGNERGKKLEKRETYPCAPPTVKTGIIGPHTKTSRIPSFGLGGNTQRKSCLSALPETDKKIRRATLPGEVTLTS